LLAKTRIVYIGAAAFRTRIVRIAATWPSALWITWITAMVTTPGTPMMSAKFTAHQITQHPI
jgi:hypothetical protein